MKISDRGPLPPDPVNPHPGIPSVSERGRMVALEEVGDAPLVAAVGRYRKEALAELYRRHGGAVLGLARRVTGDRVEGEDVTQEVFLRLWNEPERFDPARGSLRTYLLTQSHSRAVELVRSRAARLRREERDARLTATAGYDLDHEISDLALAEQISSAMDGLTPDERRAIELAYYQGHTYREVAALLHQPEGTVKSRIRAGLSRMRASLGERGVTTG
ncbi:MAG: sigma-70 family RNA polymerase sigma factor [Solirubrobacteraceae bacterium]